MLLLLHICLALGSLLFSILSIFVPHRKYIYFSGVVFITALVSGYFVGVEKNVILTHLCIKGLLYSGVIFSLLGVAYKRAHMVKKVAASINQQP